MAVKVRDVDHGYAALVRRVFDLAKPRIEVGILGAEATAAKKGHDGQDEPVTLLDVATWMEFGTDDIPERSFLRAYFDEHEAEIHARLGRLTKQVVMGKLTKAQALEQIGLYVVGEIQKRIAAGIEPENAASTIARKGSSTPLVDTGQLRQGISYRVKGG